VRRHLKENDVIAFTECPEPRRCVASMVIKNKCHGRVSGARAVRRYGSRRVRYRAIYVRIGNLVVCSNDRT
jgi:hypothetical protein